MNSNSDNDNNRKGEAPDPAELLISVLAIAGLAKTLLERSAANQDETLRALGALEAIKREIRDQGDTLKRMYTPEQVKLAGADGDGRNARHASIEDWRERNCPQNFASNSSCCE